MQARVLLIQQADIRLIRALRQQGFAVQNCDSGVEAGTKVHKAQCVVLDLELPGVPGLELVKEWRRDGIVAPVLVLASRHAADAKVKALDAGADALVTKPYDRAELIAQVKALLRRTGPADGPVLQVDDLEIDTETRIVRRAGQSIKLTRREYALLQYLAASRGKVVTRAMILANLYGSKHRRSSNIIDVHIYGLRTKIDKGFERPLIHTCYGEGYALRCDA
jgi:DNA-binding response OmpR family regulator